MKIIPVVDLMEGRVVRGKGGHREHYRPLTDSALCDQPTLDAIALGVRDRLGLDQLYVADLDAIENRKPNWEGLRRLCNQGLKLWLDAGCANVEDAQRIAECFGDRVDVILGLETIASPDVFAEVASAIGHERTILSLDLVDGKPLCAAEHWSGASAYEIADELIQGCGVRRLIVLDLRRVGMQSGPGTLPLFRHLRALPYELELVLGGGFSTLEQLHDFRDRGADGVLLATLLHQGVVGPSEIARLA